MIRKVILISMATAIAMTSAACATVKGLGRDIESVGQAGEDAIK